MSKKVLVIYYTQSGQLENILQEFCKPLSDAGHQLEWLRVYPQTPYPFPWKGNSFFTVMPNCVHGVPTPLQPFELKSASYDLVVFGYQAWFLSPSIPSNSILQDPEIKKILKNTPVITLTGARNMWISAMERIKTSLKNQDAKLVGNIALVDRHANLISFITIFYWMLTAKKDKFLNIFPPPGVSQQDVLNAARFGTIVGPYLKMGNFEGMQDELLKSGAVEIKYNLMFIESKARRIFAVWAAFISKRKNKNFWLQVYKYYLLIALFIAAPIILSVDAVLFKPFLTKRIAEQKRYYSGVN
ncbi:MAG: hypothetical protein PSX36_16250 [bacterium]|nr:hypothetical protein [bacterium]